METPSEIGKPKEDAPDGRQVFGPIAETLVDDELTDKNLMETLVAAFENTKHLVRGRGREITKKVKEMNGDILRAIGKKVLSDKAEEARPLTKRLRAELATLAERYRKTNGDAVVENLLAWARGANVEGLAEWLDKTGWALMEADTEHADKVEDALVEAWNNLAHHAFQDCAVFRDNKKWVAGFVGKRRKDTPPAGDKLEDFLPAEMDGTEKLMAKLFCAVLDDESFAVLLGLDAARALFHSNTWSVLLATMRDGEPCKWLRLLAVPWIREQAADVAARLQREEHAVDITIRPKAFTAAGNKWTPLPRAIGMASVLGGPAAVSVDGETYANEPQLAGDAAVKALRPRALDVVPADWLDNPTQLTLGIDMNAPPECVREYLIETATKTATLAELPNMTPKLLGFMFAAAPMTGRPVKGTLLDLARWMYPDWATGEGPTIKPWKDRRQNKRDLQGLGTAFVAVKNLRLVETKPDGTRHPYDLFTVDYDLSAKPDAALGFMVNPWLVERMKGGAHGGFFLVNMTRWLTMGTQNPQLFPLALRLAALWDEARVAGIYNPNRLRPIEADRLAWLCNTLPEGAAMYRAGKTDAGTAKAALSVARANMEANLDALAVAGMLGDWKPTKRKVYSKGFEFLPLPPPDYAEACKRAVQLVRHKPKT